MKLNIFFICTTLIGLVSAKPQLSSEQLNEILSNPQFGAFLQQLSQQYQQLQSSSTTETPTTTTTTQKTIKNPFFSTSTKFNEEIGLQTSAPLINLEKNPFFKRIVPKVTIRPTPVPQNVFLSSTLEASTKTPEINLENNVFFNKKVQLQSTTKAPLHIVRPKQNQAKALNKTRDSVEDEKVFKQQAESAKYAFASEINDQINDNSNYREEVRDGLNVKGKYSYSDGFFKRTVIYEADDKGYRIVGEKVEEIGKGPLTNPEGVAEVATYVAGSTLKYQITSDDIVKTNQTTSTIEEI